MSLVEKAPPPPLVGVIGSRRYPDLERVRKFVRALPSDTQIVTGAADGVDNAAGSAAGSFTSHKPVPLLFHADWKKHGKAAGHIRNDHEQP